MSNENQVPKISIEGNLASSNSALPKITADTCSCWNGKDFEKAKKLLRYATEVQCSDATAYTAMLALSVEMLMHGRKVKAKVTKGW